MKTSTGHFPIFLDRDEVFDGTCYYCGLFDIHNEAALVAHCRSAHHHRAKLSALNFFASGARLGFLAALQYADFTDEICHEICSYLSFHPFRYHLLYANSQYPISEFDRLLELNPLEHPGFPFLQGCGNDDYADDVDVFDPEDFGYDVADEDDQDLDDGTFL